MVRWFIFLVKLLLYRIDCILYNVISIKIKEIHVQYDIIVIFIQCYFNIIAWIRKVLFILSNVCILFGPDITRACQVYQTTASTAHASHLSLRTVVVAHARVWVVVYIHVATFFFRVRRFLSFYFMSDLIAIAGDTNVRVRLVADPA